MDTEKKKWRLRPIREAALVTFIKASTPSNRAYSITPPPKFYKYTRRKYAEQLTTSGGTRIGTLFDFRNEERHAGKIGDKHEGKKTMHGSTGGVFSVGTPENDALNALGFFQNLGTNNTFGEIRFTNYRVASQDAWVWCCSEEKSHEAMADVDGADTCVEIFDARGFFDALDAAVRKHIQHQLITAGPAYVAYLPAREEEWNKRDLGTDPAFVKDKATFGGQKEVRIVWKDAINRTRILEPFPLAATDCYRFCKIVDL